MSLTTWDGVRVQLCAKGWTFRDWLVKYGKSQVEVTRQIVRELGRDPKTIDPEALSALALRLITKEDSPMAATKTTAKKATAKTTSAKKNGTPRARSAMKTTGETIVELIPSGPAHSIAKSMAGGTDATHAQLKTLREAVNEAADKAREEKKTSLAQKLSDANRLVRRLERATRKA